jgi:acetyl esterase/lipase
MSTSFRQSIGAAALASLLGCSPLCHATTPEKLTVVYKQAGGVDIKADVFADASATPRPAVVWIHGGGLITGFREQLNPQVRDFAFENRFVLVSLDYRLAPETKLPAIIGDIEDAFRWLRGEGAKRFNIDPSRIAVSGSSAGGYLTLTTGFRVQPRPRVLLALWGYGDLLGDWISTPSTQPRHNARKVSAEEAAQQGSGPAIANSRDRKGDGSAIYLRARQTGEWPQLISGFDPRREAEKFTPFLPVKNVSPEFPPTFFIHGTADTDVPFDQLQLLTGPFQRQGVLFELYPINGAEHGLAGGKPDEIADAYRQAFKFVKRELLKP